MNMMQIYYNLSIFLQNTAVSFEGYQIQKKRYDAVFEKVYQDLWRGLIGVMKENVNTEIVSYKK